MAEVFPFQMSGAKYFWKLDTCSACWQIKIGKENFNLLAFGRRIGKFPHGAP